MSSRSATPQEPELASTDGGSEASGPTTPAPIHRDPVAALPLAEAPAPAALPPGPDVDSDGRGSSDTVSPSSGVSEGDGDVHCLLCDGCRVPLVRDAEVLREKAPTDRDLVFPYELEVLGADAWCYRATNPSSNRFDVVRVAASAVSRGAIACPLNRGSLDATWFPPHLWHQAACARCGHFLGWGFTEQPRPAAEPGAEPSAPAPGSDATPAADESPQEADTEQAATPAEPQAPLPLFVGLILTNTSHKSMSAAEFDALEAARAATRADDVAYQQFLQRVAPLVRQLPVMQGQAMVMMLHAAAESPQMRDNSRRMLQEMFRSLGMGGRLEAALAQPDHAVPSEPSSSGTEDGTEGEWTELGEEDTDSSGDVVLLSGAGADTSDPDTPPHPE